MKRQIRRADSFVRSDDEEREDGVGQIYPGLHVNVLGLRLRVYAYFLRR